LFCSSNGGKTNFTSLSRTCSTTPQDQTVSEDGLQLCDAIISPNIGNIEDTIPNDFLRSSMEGEETTTLVLKGFLFYSYFIVILSYAIPAPVTERNSQQCWKITSLNTPSLNSLCKRGYS
uniref:Uncharacterized protein n=1 Tax=Labrus bergylta TaxID=56723 RepID=A0A3Q3E527_9LABR